MRAVYVPTEPDATFGFLHPASGEGDGAAVLICPPFGWEDFCSYRSRRTWADALAAAGHPALRIDLPATGDFAVLREPRLHVLAEAPRVRMKLGVGQQVEGRVRRRARDWIAAKRRAVVSRL